MILTGKLDKLDSAFKAAMLKNKLIAKEARSAKDPALYTRENQKSNMAKTKTEVINTTAEMKQIFIENIKESHENLNKYYKRERSENSNYHFMRAERINQARSLEEGREIYRRQLNRMDPETRQKHRFAYDDSLAELAARLEPEAGFMVEDTIDEYRPAVEKAYITESKVALEMFKQFPTLEAAIQTNLTDIENGEEPTSFKWAQIINEMKVNAIRNIIGAEEPKGEAKQAALKINPYADEPAEEEAEVSV